MPSLASEPSAKPSNTSERSKLKGSQSTVVLIAYILSTFLYTIAIRSLPAGKLAVIPFAILAFFIPDFMVIKLLSNPYTLTERLLLFWVGPFPLAFMLHSLLRTS